MGRLIHFSGAGLSAESGVPTFRDENGLWMGFDPDKVCNYSNWKENFEDVHEFYNSLRVKLGEVSPNAAHMAVADWASRYETLVFTQNVDDLFERSGVRPVKIHGDLLTMKCEACGNVWSICYTAFEPGSQCASHKCGCKKAIKPNVVFFGEMAPLYGNLYEMLESLTDDDVIVVVGTSSSVVDIHAFLREYPGYKIVNNLVPTSGEESVYDVFLHMPATEAVPHIDSILREKLG